MSYGGLYYEMVCEVWQVMRILAKDDVDCFTAVRKDGVWGGLVGASQVPCKDGGRIT